MNEVDVADRFPTLALLSGAARVRLMPWHRLSIDPDLYRKLAHGSRRRSLFSRDVSSQQLCKLFLDEFKRDARFGFLIRAANRHDAASPIRSDTVLDLRPIWRSLWWLVRGQHPALRASFPFLAFSKKFDMSIDLAGQTRCDVDPPLPPSVGGFVQGMIDGLLALFAAEGALPHGTAQGREQDIVIESEIEGLKWVSAVSVGIGIEGVTWVRGVNVEHPQLDGTYY